MRRRRSPTLPSGPAWASARCTAATRARRSCFGCCAPTASRSSCARYAGRLTATGSRGRCSPTTSTASWPRTGCPGQQARGAVHSDRGDVRGRHDDAPARRAAVQPGQESRWIPVWVRPSTTSASFSRRSPTCGSPMPPDVGAPAANAGDTPRGHPPGRPRPARQGTDLGGDGGSVAAGRTDLQKYLHRRQEAGDAAQGLWTCQLRPACSSACSSRSRSASWSKPSGSSARVVGTPRAKAACDEESLVGGHDPRCRAIGHTGRGDRTSGRSRRRSAASLSRGALRRSGPREGAGAAASELRDTTRRETRACRWRRPKSPPG